MLIFSSMSQVHMAVVCRGFVSVYVALNLVIFETSKVNSHFGVPVTQSRMFDKYENTDVDHENGLVEFSLLFQRRPKRHGRGFCLSDRLILQEGRAIKEIGFAFMG